MKQAVIYLAILSAIFVSCKNRQANETDKTKAMTDSISFESGYAIVNGLKMYYELHGRRGNYLVLIHGGGSTIGTSFGRVLPMLANNHRVIAVELQAHGHTGDRDAPESFEQDADDVAALLHHLHIAKASFLGFSNGGNTAMQIAVRYPELVDKLILASTFYQREGLPPGFFDGMQRATLNDMPEVLRDAFLKINPDSGRLMTMFNKDRERMLHFKDWKDEMLQSISVPTLIIQGDQDVILPEHAVKMSKLIPNSRLMILPGEHGAYLGAAESPAASSDIIELTVAVINHFLE